MSQRIDSPAPKKACKSMVKPIKVTIVGEPILREPERVETSTSEPFEIPIQTPPRSPILQSVSIHTEEVLHQTPPQQHQTVQEPRSTSKRTSTPRQSQHSAEFNKMFSDILVFGSRPVSLEDVPDMSFFDENRIKVVEDRVSKLVKDKASSDEKIKNLEVENVVLKNEVQALNEKVAGLEADNVALNEVVQGVVTTNEQLSTSNTMLTSENEILKKTVNDHEADKKLKSKHTEMLYVVFESKMGTSIEAEFDQVEIQRAEARRIEREKKAAEEAAKAAKDKGK
ncbi:hypothetical protein HanRHA438_Chr02g0067671 [Helianthus annuus]|nr:hypothetical protein HanRHA438_Chr02g0067671 [Helianthus annuus]